MHSASADKGSTSKTNLQAWAHLGRLCSCDFYHSILIETSSTAAKYPGSLDFKLPIITSDQESVPASIILDAPIIPKIMLA